MFQEYLAQFRAQLPPGVDKVCLGLVIVVFAYKYVQSATSNIRLQHMPDPKKAQ